MARREEVIKKKYEEIIRSIDLPPLDYKIFFQKLSHASNIDHPQPLKEIGKRDLIGIYLSVGAHRKIPEYTEYIYRSYRDAMLRTAVYFFSGDKSRAEDIVHDVFTSLKWESFRGTGSLKGWLRTVTANRCLDTLRAQKGRNLGLDKAKLTNNKDPEIKTATEECRKKLLSSIKMAFEDIGYESKNLLVFTYVEGVTVRDLARTYGTSPATISRKVRSARDELGKAIIKYSKERFSMSDEDIENCLNLIFEKGLSK